MNEVSQQYKRIGLFVQLPSCCIIASRATPTELLVITTSCQHENSVGGAMIIIILHLIPLRKVESIQTHSSIARLIFINFYTRTKMPSVTIYY
jgi:hypothetical protein